MNEKSNLPRAGLVLRALSEYDVRNICGQSVIRCRTPRLFTGENLTNEVFKELSLREIGESERNLPSTGRNKQSFEASITLGMNSNRTRYRTSGDCSCALSREEGSLCSHVASLMIAWVRKSQDFEESVKFDFDDARRRSMDSLDKLVISIEDGDSGFKDDIEMLQRTYTKSQNLGIRDCRCEISRRSKCGQQ